MGGDDVGSDDEQYLNPDVGAPSDSDELSDEEEQYEGRKSRNAKLQKKRSRAQAIEAIAGAITADTSKGEGDSDDSGVQSSSKRSKKAHASSGGAGPQLQRKLLLEAARGIGKEKPDVQAAFLWTCYTHALRMKGKVVNDDDKFGADHFYAPGTVSKKNKSQKQSQQNSKKNKGEGGPLSIATYLKGGALTSMKRLKKWKHTGSPMVIIVCISARRAVQILKQLAPLNVRAAKLFAKHMDLDEQITMLRTNSFGIAVGTPNRLLKLIESGDGGSGSGSDSDDSDGPAAASGALSLNVTELLVIDNHEDSKAFTVCTMNDTAPDLMQFLHKAVVPQMRKRKTLKIAMF